MKLILAHWVRGRRSQPHPGVSQFAALGLLAVCLGCQATPQPATPAPGQARAWAFAVMSDPRPGKYQGGFEEDLKFYREQLIRHATPDWPAPEFFLLLGDLDPVDQTDGIVSKYLGRRYPWVPVMGNHDFKSRAFIPKVLARFRSKLKIQPGPKGTEEFQFHFTYRNALFVCLNNYWTGATEPGAAIGKRSASKRQEGKKTEPKGEVAAETLNYLRAVSVTNPAPWKLAFGHVPAWPFSRHKNEGLCKNPERRDRFWQLLAQLNFAAYFCGHTHHYSTYQWLGNADPARWQDYTSKIIPDPLGVWQIDAGNARGRKASEDRAIVYCKVAGNEMQILTYLAARIKKGKFKNWTVPKNRTKDDQRQLFRWTIKPYPQENLPEF